MYVKNNDGDLFALLYYGNNSCFMLIANLRGVWEAKLPETLEGRFLMTQHKI